MIVCLAAWAFVNKSDSLLTISQLAFSLAFVVNHPHFLSSYMLMYGDFKKSIFEKRRYFFSAVIAPLVLIAVLGAALFQQNSTLIGHVVSAMFVLVGWHYVKQVFGFVIVSAAQRKNYYKTWERRLLYTNLISVWAMSALASHVGTNSFDFYGIRHQSLGLPMWTLHLTYWVVGISFLATLAMHVNKYIRDGSLPAPVGVAAYFALYVWYVPMISHPAFGYLIPFFHSLQYLTFVWLLKKNQILFQINTFKDAAWRSALVKKVGGFAVGSLFLGALFFEWLPKSIEATRLIPAGTMGTSPILVSFLLFINIHHYFIDNAIWRSDNPTVTSFLIKPDKIQESNSGLLKVERTA